MTHLKENAKGEALNSIGRSTGRRFNMAAIKREFSVKYATSIGFEAKSFEDGRKKRDATKVKG